MTIQARKAAIDQIGYVTADLDGAVARWTGTLGVGPWKVFRDVKMTGEYRGEPVSVLIDVALGYRGGEQIELIQPRSDGPSPYQAADGTPLAGLHHIAWIVDDLAEEIDALEMQGMHPVFRASTPAIEVAYLEDPEQPGMLFEVISGPDAREMHREGVAIARHWDGSDPIIEIDLSPLTADS